ncbi:nucleoside triphosphate pyrophosphatase [Demequina sp. NBRC 110054]|uniref:Maf family protein n=1 Tax=Demequina sp. NBRC 110054 TaxID=1570343 RepID=UPI0009FC7B01|nr:nucleoside triphosphate pyrophosphatase [Demequina sp. NBRC 110054]
MPIPFVLASQSPARLATLRAAGVDPEVIVSDVDEDAALAHAREAHLASGLGELAFDDSVLVLAQAKAEVVADGYETQALVLGCDSMLEIDGEILGKPGDPATAIARWQTMRGRVGVLHTGHWIVDDRPGGSGATVGATASTTVRFADLSDDEIEAYVATGEPLHVAGAFTVDSLGGPYVESIDGDYHAVVGVSLPLLRHLLGACGVAFHELWRDSVRG